MKEALIEYHKIDQKINKLRYTIALIRQRAQSPSSARLSHMPKSPGNADWLSESLAEIDELEGQCEKLQEMKRTFQPLFQLLTPMEQRVLQLRYGKKASWIVIGMKTNYSDRQAQRIHNRALKKLQTALEAEGGEGDGEDGGNGEALRQPAF